MPFASKEACAAYNREYQRKNREKLREYFREYQRKNRERVRERFDAWAEKNPERIAKYRADNVPKAREYYRQQTAKVAPRPRPELCELCGGPSGKKALNFDHCHAQGHFRGWLCTSCNLALGNAKDNPELLRRMADYVEQGGIR